MLLTMHDGRTRLAQDVEREVREHFPDLVFDTVIPRNVRVGEAPSFGRAVIHHDPQCAGADAYFAFATRGRRPWLNASAGWAVAWPPCSRFPTAPRRTSCASWRLTPWVRTPASRASASTSRR